MTPMEAYRREFNAALDAIERRLGPKDAPTSVTIRVKSDRSSGMPCFVEVNEERTHKIVGGSVS